MKHPVSASTFYFRRWKRAELVARSLNPTDSWDDLHTTFKSSRAHTQAHSILTSTAKEMPFRIWKCLESMLGMSEDRLDFQTRVIIGIYIIIVPYRFRLEMPMKRQTYSSNTPYPIEFLISSNCPDNFFFFRFNMYGNNQAKHTVPFLGSFTMMGSKLYGGVNFRRKSNPAPWVLCVLLRVWYWCYFWRFGYFRVCLKQTLNIDTLLDLFLWVMNLAIWDVIERHLSQWERRIDLLFRTIFAHSMMPFGVFLV